MTKNVSGLLKTNPFLTQTMSQGSLSNKTNGEDFVTSDPGSTISAAKYIIAEIPLLVERHGIQSILHLPCGDYNWMRKVKFKQHIDYIGGDNNSELIELNKSRFPELDFRVIDILSDTIPASDLVICKDLFTHFTFEETQIALANIKASGSKYLLTTTFSWRIFAPKNNIKIPKDAGRTTLTQWTRLNLFMEPFNMPPCLDFIIEFNRETDNPNPDKNYGFGDKILALWDCNSL